MAKKVEPEKSEPELTPLQKAEMQANSVSLLDVFLRLVEEAEDRYQHGITLNHTFVEELRDVFDAISAGANIDEPFAISQEQTSSHQNGSGIT